ENWPDPGGKNAPRPPRGPGAGAVRASKNDVPRSGNSRAAQPAPVPARCGLRRGRLRGHRRPDGLRPAVRHQGGAHRRPHS
ncbi:MAG: Lysine ketoglutarate reductase (LKR) / Saccharopine dehydrogenase, partial [uncultured Cytophagales bacterium]